MNSNIFSQTIHFSVLSSELYAHAVATHGIEGWLSTLKGMEARAIDDFTVNMKH